MIPARLWLSLTCVLLSGSASFAASRPAPHPAPLRYRWVWSMHYLNSDEQTAKLQDLMRRAKKAGFNGVVLSDYGLGVSDRLTPHYRDNVAAVKKTADVLGLDLYPVVCPIGYSNGLLAHDPNLAEGLPVREEPFVVHGRLAGPDVSAGSPLKNGDFEEAAGDKMAGWTFQDNSGTGSFADKAIHHGGVQALRLDDIGKADPQYGHGRIMQSVAVSPFRQYRLSFWIKTQDFEAPGSVQALALDPKGNGLAYNDVKVQKTQDWTQYRVVFNSLGNSQVSLYLGSWGGKAGKLWLDDARLENPGLLNVLRRSGCPLTVKGTDGTLYQEGRDYEPVKDDSLGVVPYAGQYDLAHDAPTIHLTANSRLRDGQALRVSYYHAVVTGSDQVACCLSAPRVYALMRDGIRRVNAMLHPKGFLMSHDELRVANWDQECRQRHLTPGQLLADNVRRCTQMIRHVSPQAHVFVWSDMFDPFHNAHDNYYLVNGSWAGSWKGLAPDVVTVDWSFDARQKDAPFFASQGHEQVLAGYYDSPAGVPQIRTWQEDVKGVPGIRGVMYTTWGANYDDLEAFAQSAWGMKESKDANAR